MVFVVVYRKHWHIWNGEQCMERLVYSVGFVGLTNPSSNPWISQAIYDLGNDEATGISWPLAFVYIIVWCCTNVSNEDYIGTLSMVFMPIQSWVWSLWSQWNSTISHRTAAISLLEWEWMVSIYLDVHGICAAVGFLPEAFTDIRVIVHEDIVEVALEHVH